MARGNKFFGKKTQAEQVFNVPAHIAIIPDGNGRWAKKRGLPRSVGHREGSMTLKKIVIYCSKLGVSHLTFYAFSTENWKRPKEEVSALMNLLMEFMQRAEKELEGSNVRIKVIGNVDELSDELKKEIVRVEKYTSQNSGLQLNIALNYGSRNEIVHAIKSIVNAVENKELSTEDISEEIFEKHLYTREIPDPDLLIRTSGEQRISNYLLWQLAYTELWFSDKLWPDFNETDIAEAIKDYNNRERRFGGV